MFIQIGRENERKFLFTLFSEVSKGGGLFEGRLDENFLASGRFSIWTNKISSEGYRLKNNINKERRSLAV